MHLNEVRVAHLREGAAEEGDHGSEGLISSFWIEAWPFVPAEGVFGGEETSFTADAGGFEAAVNCLSRVGGNVRVLLAEDHQQLAANFLGARK